MTNIQMLFNKITSFSTSHNIPLIGLADAFEIILIAILMYFSIYYLRNTRLKMITNTLLAILIVYGAAYFLSLSVLLYILNRILIIIGAILAVAIQPEARRFLDNMSNQSLNGVFKQIMTSLKHSKDTPLNTKLSESDIEHIVNAMFSMGEAKTGVLLVIEGENTLIDYANTGIYLNADITASLLINIFEKNTPLHDGATLINNRKILSSTCYLPLSSNPSIDKSLGTRHRAAIGLSEITDSLTIVVSEETGKISTVYRGEITRHNTPDSLRNTLDAYISRFDDSSGRGQVGAATRAAAGTSATSAVGLKISSMKNPGYLKLKAKQLAKSVSALKLLSIFLAVMMWFMIVSITNPITSKRFKNIPVNLDLNTSQNDTMLSGLGSIGSLGSDTNKQFVITSGDHIDILLRGRKDIIDEITPEDIIATASLSDLSITNTLPIKITLPYDIEYNTYGQVVKLDIDEIVTKEIPLVVYHTAPSVSNDASIPNDPSSDSSEDTPVIGDSPVITTSQKIINPYMNIKNLPSYINVSAPKNTLDKIEEIFIEIDNNLPAGTHEIPVHVIDSNDNEMILSNFTSIPSSISLDIDILPSKIVPLNLNLRYTDVYVENLVTSIDFPIDTIELVGELDVISEFEQFDVDLVVNTQIDNLSGNIIQRDIFINEYLPYGVKSTIPDDESLTLGITLDNYVITSIDMLFDYISILYGNTTPPSMTVINADDLSIKVIGRDSSVYVMDIYSFNPYAIFDEIEYDSENDYYILPIHFEKNDDLVLEVTPLKIKVNGLLAMTS